MVLNEAQIWNQQNTELVAADRCVGTVQRGTTCLCCREVVQQLSIPQNNLEEKITASGQKVSSCCQEEGWSKLWKSGFSLHSATGIFHNPGQEALVPPGNSTSNCHQRHSCACDRLRTRCPSSRGISEGCCGHYEVADEVDSSSGMRAAGGSSLARAVFVMLPSNKAPCPC